MDNVTLVTILTFQAIVLFCFYWYYKQTYNHWARRNIAYLSPTIPFGNLQKVFMRKCSLGEAFAEAYYEFKKMGVKHGGVYAFNSPVYMPLDPDIIKKIVTNDGNTFIDHGYYIEPENDPLSAHLFNMKGEQWKNIRTKITHAFTLAKLKKMFLTLVDFSKEFENHLELCRKEYPDGIQMDKEALKVTTDGLSKCLYGMETNALKDDNKDLLKNLNNFILEQWGFYRFSMVFMFPINILKMIKFRLFGKEQNEFAKKIFMELKQYRKKFNIHRDDLADILVGLSEKKENQKNHNGIGVRNALTDDAFVAQMWVFMGAGTESSATTISFALYELSRNTNCQNMLRKEINDILAQYDYNLTFDALKEMTYLDGVVNETLRLYPVFPVLFRLCQKDYCVPGTDFIMERNTLALISTYGLQRDPEYFPNPSQFDPERFSPENKAKRPFITHMPFGEGPRICPGKRFAMLQIKVELITIIKNYEVSLSNKTMSGSKFPPWELILRKAGGIWLKLRKLEER